MRPALILAAGLVGCAAWILYREPAAVGAAGEDAGEVGPVDSIGVAIVAALTDYTPDKVPAQYRAAIAQAESANGIPPGMLARLLWQESRYRPEIISGAQRSPVGAVGIAQFMPATAREWGVIATDAGSSIAGAGRYLAWLFRKTGSWALALAAYNWGIGNVQRQGIAAAPAETTSYFSEILADLGMTV